MKKNVLVINGADFSQNSVEQISYVEPLNMWVSGLGDNSMSVGSNLDGYTPNEGFIYDENTIINGNLTGEFLSQKIIQKICIYIQSHPISLIVGKKNKTTGVLTPLGTFAVPAYTSNKVTNISDGKNIIDCNILIPEDSYLYLKFSGQGSTIIADNSNNTDYAPFYNKLHGGSKIQTDGTAVVRQNTSPLIDFYI